MRAHALHTSEISAAHRGWVLAHDLHGPGGIMLLPKGSVLDADALMQVAHAAPDEVHLLELEADELHEDAAGRRVARAVAGEGLSVTEPLTSRYDLVTEGKGLLRVDADLLRAVNEVPDVTVYTLLDRQPVLPGKVVASVKITPIATPEARVVEVERLCKAAARPPLVVLPFQPKRVAIVAIDELSPEQRGRFESAIRQKLAWYGAELTDLRYAAPDTGDIGAAFDSALRTGAEIVLSAGGNTIDPLDPVEQALSRIGATVVHRGAPTRGSMCWLAEAGDVPIMNLASARMYVGNTVGDLILPLLLTGQRVTPADIVDIGYGGLLLGEMAFRFPPYDESSEAESR